MTTSTSTGNYLVPKPVGDLLARLPAYPGSLLFVGALNLALAGKLASDVTPLLAGRKLRLRVTDAQWAFDFEWCKGRFVAGKSAALSAEADLTISASAYDFMLLARRLEDPDTLFFSRRLSMEGDTELGLLVKNSLDAIEMPLLTLEQFKPSRVFASLKARFAPA
jgi:O2-independent ubiquinone biosynthesis accessory factor UbiT